MVLLALVVVFVVVPILELYVIIQVAHVIGGWQTLALLVVESAIGVWLLKRQGIGVLDRINAALRNHQLPHRELVDGFLILLAGALMLAPGFLTDIVGYLLLIPVTRSLFRSLVLRRFTGRLGRGVGWMARSGGRRRRSSDRPVTDATGHEAPQPPPARPGSGGELPPGRY